MKHHVTGPKLPSNGQVLAVLFYNIREGNLSVIFANITIQECLICWKSARIPTKALTNCVKKLVVNFGGICKKNANRT